MFGQPHWLPVFVSRALCQLSWHWNWTALTTHILAAVHIKASTGDETCNTSRQERDVSRDILPAERDRAQSRAANASLASNKSRSPTVQPAFSSAFLEAGIGPMSIADCWLVAGSLKNCCTAMQFQFNISDGALSLRPVPPAKKRDAGFIPSCYYAATQNAGQLAKAIKWPCSTNPNRIPSNANRLS